MTAHNRPVARLAFARSASTGCLSSAGQYVQSDLCWRSREGLKLFVMGIAHKRAGHNVEDIKRRSFPKTQPLKLPKANIMPFHSPAVFLGIV